MRKYAGLKYSPQTGLIYSSTKGKPVGSDNGKGYLTFGHLGKYYKVHRAAYEIMRGGIPKGKQIDHINGNKKDNRFFNLRVVTNRENQQNRKLHQNGKLLGSYYNAQQRGKKKWYCSVRHNGNKVYLGSYLTEMDAHIVYMQYLDKHSVPYQKEIDKRQVGFIVPPRYTPRVPECVRDEIEQYYAQGFRVTEIAQALKLDRHTVSKQVNKRVIKNANAS